MSILDNPYKLAKQIWKTDKGNLRGFDSAWHAHNNTNPQSQQTTTEDAITALALVKVEGGYSCHTYSINDGQATLISASEAEDKNFTAGKIKQKFLEIILEK